MPELLTTYWHLLLPLIVGALAVLALLPQPRRLPTPVGAGLLTLALALAIAGIANKSSGGAALVDQILFYGFSFVAVVSGVLLVTQVQPARAALSFTLVVLATCGLFLLLAAPFLFAATIIVYAGAIIVTFLFVLMLAQQTGRDDADLRSREPLLAVVTGFVLLGTLFYLIEQHPKYLAREAEVAPKGERALAALDRLTRTAGRAARAPSLDVLRAVVDSAALKKEGQQPIPLPRLLDTNIREARLETQQKAADRLTALSSQLVDLGQPRPGFEAQKEYYGKLEALGRQALAVATYGQPAPAYSGLSGPVGLSPEQARAGKDGQWRALPAENSTYLGKSLFTDYLLPVELGGLLLLVAVVGAIVIAQRQDEQGKESA